MAKLPVGLRDVARMWLSNLDSDSLISVEIAADPEEKELRMVVVSTDFEELPGEALPFAYWPLPTTGYPCVVLGIGAREREELAKGERAWPEGWGSPPELVPLYEAPKAPVVPLKSIDLVRKALIGLGFYEGGIHLKEEALGRVTGYVVSDKFAGMGSVRRQEYLSFGLRSRLSSKPLQDIVFLGAMTRAEVSD